MFLVGYVCDVIQWCWVVICTYVGMYVVGDILSGMERLGVRF